MSKRKASDVLEAMSPGDPRRPIKARRLGEERARIPGFQVRPPQLDDADFEEWERTVQSLLRELFGAGEFLLRFRQLRIRPINHYMNGHSEWHGDYNEAWRTGLIYADKILAEALEELGIELPAAAAADRTREPSAANIVVNVQNQNIFSASVHVTVTQLLERLDSLGLSQPERELAEEQVKELQSETEGQKRWPLIAKSLETIKSLGKGVYKEIAVPLIVEFLKKESGLSGH